MGGQPFSQVDAFTDKAFGGNPAAVLLLPAARDASWMQLVAREMNLAETAFLVARGTEFDLRWFTPSTEVDLCGHATIASAHVLWESGHLPPAATARFQTRSGPLSARRDGDWIWLDFPAKPLTTIEPPAGLGAALGTPVRYTGTNDLGYLLVEVDSERAVRELRPDPGRIAMLPARGVVVTSRGATAGRDFVSRFFAPAMGVPEDPVTGSSPLLARTLLGGAPRARGAERVSGIGTRRRRAGALGGGPRAHRGPGGDGTHRDAARGMSLDAFAALDVRVGRIIRAELNEKARKPAYKLWIDFGPLGERRSSAQLTDVYAADELAGRLVIAAMNLGSRTIAGFESEVLVLGVPDTEGHVVLLTPDSDVPLGGRMY